MDSTNHIEISAACKENGFSIGAYPGIGFKEARDIARGARRDVALSNIEDLKNRQVVTSNPAIERPPTQACSLRLDDCSDGSVAAAMRLLVMLPVRPGELVVALRREQDQASG